MPTSPQVSDRQSNGLNLCELYTYLHDTIEWVCSWGMGCLWKSILLQGRVVSDGLVRCQSGQSQVCTYISQNVSYLSWPPAHGPIAMSIQNLDSTFGSVRCHPEQQWLCCFKCERHRIHAHWTQVHARTICEPLLRASNSLYILSTEQTAVCFPHMGPQQNRTVLW